MFKNITKLTSLNKLNNILFKSFSHFNLQQFPSLVIQANNLIPQGSYAERQAEYLYPDQKDIFKLKSYIQENQIGLVAHYYMDAEIQGVLTQCQPDKYIIADSLAMGQSAVKMVENGAKRIIVMGVDFMTENVQAILQKSGYEYIPVYKLSNQKIGCSLAEAAEKQSYLAYLLQAKRKCNNPLHVIYINTSLVTKGLAQNIVPTITCTSSNVVKTILQSFSQNSDINIFFGPDTYMGQNLQVLFQQLSSLPNDQIKKLHPDHNQESIRQLIDRFHYFKEGNCVVHHQFDGSVVDNIKQNYNDDYITGHLEVPGEFFNLAIEKQYQGKGVVGSTSDIINFIIQKTQECVKNNKQQKRLRFVLGTETGMVTMIVNKVQEILRNTQKEVEIIFPVSQEAISQQEGQLKIVPGVSQGEGCSVSGGCATCKYMKMNSLDTLFEVCQLIQNQNERELQQFQIKNKSITNIEIINQGMEPIINMQYFQRNGKLSDQFMVQVSQQLNQAI